MLLLVCGRAAADDPSVDPLIGGEPISKWLKDLQSENAAVHDKADEALAAAGKAVIPALTRVIRHSDAEVRVLAIEMIDVIGEDAKEAIPELAKALSDAVPSVRGAAAETLGGFGPARQRSSAGAAENAQG